MAISDSIQVQLLSFGKQDQSGLWYATLNTTGDATGGAITQRIFFSAGESSNLWFTLTGLYIWNNDTAARRVRARMDGDAWNPTGLWNATNHDIFNRLLVGESAAFALGDVGGLNYVLPLLLGQPKQGSSAVLEIVHSTNTDQKSNVVEARGIYHFKTLPPALYA